MSFNQLRWYSNSIMENNPHSYINLEFDKKTRRFVRYFSSFCACIDGFHHCRPLLFLDGTFLKARFKGNLLVPTAKDDNQGLFPVAFTIVDSENSANWEWFLRHLKEIVGVGRTLTLITVMLVYCNLCQLYSRQHITHFCLLHLQMNFRDQMKYVNALHEIGLMCKL
ncbi:hypothetical protein ACSBR2_015968 [Camellia fascicularis]